MKRIYIDVDDGFSYKDCLSVLSNINIDEEFIKSMGVKEL